MKVRMTKVEAAELLELLKDDEQGFVGSNGDVPGLVYPLAYLLDRVQRVLDFHTAPMTNEKAAAFEAAMTEPTQTDLTDGV